MCITSIVDKIFALTLLFRILKFCKEIWTLLIVKLFIHSFIHNQQPARARTRSAHLNDTSYLFLSRLSFRCAKFCRQKTSSGFIEYVSKSKTSTGAGGNNTLKKQKYTNTHITCWLINTFVQYESIFQCTDTLRESQSPVKHRYMKPSCGLNIICLMLKALDKSVCQMYKC